ncbi:MAG: excinuclease ABC subunit UvrA [Bacteroidales bacterium]|nr:excinuclease ABC subunit UvrA [Bacteroidales bacterium]
MKNTSIEVFGARVHNLKNIDINIPHNKLTVITGLSGSGKSSLAFDTIYAEGQRRYIETFSSYGRQFLGNLERPDVDKINGLSPVISIEQKSTNRNPRSTVGTITEINDFLRLWYSKAAIAYSPNTGEEMIQHTQEQILNIILDQFKGQKIYILAPVVRSRKGHYRELFAKFYKKGFIYARIDGKLVELSDKLMVERYQNHNIEIVIDKATIPENIDETFNTKRFKDSISLAMKNGKGVIMIMDKDSEEAKYFSQHLMCPTTGLSYDLPAPNTFSFNSPQGYCPKCKGLGYIEELDINKIVPNQDLSIYAGAITPVGKITTGLMFWQISALCKKHDLTIKSPFKELPKELVREILYGTDEKIRLDNTPLGPQAKYYTKYEGIAIELKTINVGANKTLYDDYVEQTVCPVCKGTKLKQEALNFKIDGKTISELSNLDITELENWLTNIELKLTKKQNTISFEIIKEIRSRVTFLLDVGLGYLSLNRNSASLSGGESQRIRLATQIGSQLVNVLYILDEPSIGLHQRDNARLIKSLQNLRDSGNTVIVVEHDKEMMLSADYLVDLGPKAGKHGGKIIAAGTPKSVLKTDGLTAKYLSGKIEIEIPKERREGTGNKLTLIGASGNNLKNVTVDFPLGTFICVTGVSGSGKSTLINDTLYPILSNKINRSSLKPLKHDELTGLEHINKIAEVDQSPLGRTPRSNPATYTQVFTDIRNLYALLPDAQIRGYKAGRFSFNVKGGRCETCKGAGLETIEMKLLPDVYVTCRECDGRRYNRETLTVRFKSKSIADVLDMTINEAVRFFENHPKILRKVKTLQEVGLGYIKLGQSSTTLSGGESQRVKLSAELSKVATGKTVYILDEPTTGMHFEDIKMLLDVIQKLVDKQNTVIVIEHNLDVIKTADYVIDIGPEGGKEGGEIVFAGTPEELAKKRKSFTGKYLKEELKN